MQKAALIFVIPLLAVGMGHALVWLSHLDWEGDRPTASAPKEPRSYTWEEKDRAAHEFRAYLETLRDCHQDADCVLVTLDCPVGVCSTSVAARQAQEVRHELALIREKFPCMYRHAVAPCQFTATPVCQAGKCEVHREPLKR